MGNIQIVMSAIYFYKTFVDGIVLILSNISVYNIPALAGSSYIYLLPCD
jgi:hypothetical protein